MMMHMTFLIILIVLVAFFALATRHGVDSRPSEHRAHRPNWL